MAKIQKNHPELHVNYVGSASLKILGKKDIDLLLGCHKKFFRKYAKDLTKILGKPTKKRFGFVEWFFEKDDFSIEIRFDKLPSKFYSCYL